MSKVLNKHSKGYDHYLNMEGVFVPQSRLPTSNKLTPGIYRIGQTPEGKMFFSPMSAMTDGLVDLPHHISEEVIREVNKFWLPETRALFDSYGLVYKRGVLLHGAPGTGKTVITSKIMEQVVANGGLVFFDASPKLLFEGVNLIKEIQGDVKILAVYEEFDAWIQGNSDFLSLLDGELQIENVVYLATTNYIDKIPPRIKNRPSRFAQVIEVGVPDAQTREAFLKGKIGKNAEIDIVSWVSKTEGMTLDHLKDLIVSVLCIGLELDVAISKLRTMNAGDLVNDSDNDEEYYDDDYVERAPKTMQELIQRERDKLNRMRGR